MIDKSIFQVGDICLTSAMTPLACGIRAKTAGIKNTFNKKIANHAGMVWSLDGSNNPSCLFIAEMLTTIKMTSFQEYENNGYFGPQIIMVLRHSIYNDEDNRRILNNRIREDMQNVKEYDYKGILEFLWPLTKDRPDKYYCSEMVRHYIQCDGGDIESPYCGKEDDISPFGIQVATNLSMVWHRY